MLKCILFRCSVLAALLFIGLTLSAQEQRFPKDVSKDAKLELLRLYTLGSLKTKVSKDANYSFSRDDLERAICADLAKHHESALPAVRDEFRKNFDVFFDRLIQQAVGPFDLPELGLASWLRKKTSEIEPGQKDSLK